MPTRAENRRDTLLRLGAAAVELFERDGIGVTIDAIAELAEVSPRTVFRYIDAKEELAYVHPVLWFDIFDQALQAHGPGPLRARLKAGCFAVADHIDADPEPPRRAFLVTMAHPQLLSGFNAIFQRWIDRISTEALRQPSQRADRMRARIIGSAVMGVVDATTREWLTSTRPTSYRRIFTGGFNLLSDLLEDG